MDDLDAVLMRLAQAPVPAGLDGIEAWVLARIATRPALRVGMGAGAMTIAAALVEAAGAIGRALRDSVLGRISWLEGHSRSRTLRTI